MLARRRGIPWVQVLWSLALLAGGAVIAAGSAVYFEEEIPPFMLEKLPLPREALWLWALQVHVVATALALPGCVVLVWPALLRRAPAVHRWLGRVTGVVILLAVAPSGLYLSAWAKGGAWSTAGFVLSGLIVVVGMVQAVRTARARDFVAHRRASLHVLAQLSVAVTSRLMLLGFAALPVEEDTAYLIALWVPVLSSALAVELLVTRRTSWRNHAEASRAVQPRRRPLRLGQPAA